MNVLDFAIEMENDGFEYYKDLADSSTLPGLKTIFTSLAADELKHAKVFKDLVAGETVGKMPASETLETSKNLFKQLPGGSEGLKNIADSLKAYQHAMKLEANSFRFYEEIAEKETNPEVKALLLQIAEEEHAHFNILENVYSFVNAPNQSLEWGEFSNLGEFRQFGRETDG
ncbi:ferritin family protein [Deltaproteobacteria bacterium IMCC39524]|nr:ferritin family protein [Deltaproteobacteria bacterium IMCC39524]